MKGYLIWLGNNLKLPANIAPTIILKTAQDYERLVFRKRKYISISHK